MFPVVSVHRSPVFMEKKLDAPWTYFFFFTNTVQTLMLTYTHSHSPLRIHTSAHTSLMSISERLNRQILHIDEVTIGGSLSRDTSPTIERIAPVKFRNKFKKIQAPIPSQNYNIHPHLKINLGPLSLVLFESLKYYFKVLHRS